MSGVVAGLLASVKAGSAPAPTNILTNGSFTTNLNGWETASNLSRDTVTFRSAPASGYTFTTEEYFADVAYSQASGLTSGQSYSLSAWIRNPNTAQSFNIFLRLGTNSYFETTATLGVSTAWQQIKIENKSSNGSAILFSFTPTVGAEYNVDDVSLVLGSTALP